MTRTRYPRVSPLAAALKCRCPRCGEGRLYKGFLSVSDRCEVCGLALARGDSGDGPAVFLTFILGFTVVPVALWVAMSVDWPLWLHAVVWTVVILGLALGMLRPAKAYLMALQFRHRASEYDIPETPESRADPRN
ncbi:DUF983 domain-containing protein [Skermanella rosea]|nr:DUF983 domain-containing protein [Skermanella rosea]